MFKYMVISYGVLTQHETCSPDTMLPKLLIINLAQYAVL